MYLRNELRSYEKFVEMEPLTHVEEETMQAIWPDRGRKCKSFMEHLDEQIPYTTVASTIKRTPKRKATSIAGAWE